MRAIIFLLFLSGCTPEVRYVYVKEPAQSAAAAPRKLSPLEELAESISPGITAIAPAVNPIPVTYNSPAVIVSPALTSRYAPLMNSTGTPVISPGPVPGVWFPGYNPYAWGSYLDRRPVGIPLSPYRPKHSAPFNPYPLSNPGGHGWGH